MSDDSEEKERKRPKLPRITVGLDDFDHKVVTKMSKNRKLPLSEVMRIIVHQWIEFNPEILKRNYGIDLREVTEELKSETTKISIDKIIKPYEREIINELPVFFKMVEDVAIEDLAEHFDVNSKTIKKIIFTHGKQINKVGLNLKLREGRIYKI